MTEPQPLLADTELVRECLDLLSTAQGEVEKDVVTDFGAYGLAEPIRQYLLKSAATNASDTASNRLIARLDIGGRRSGKVFARGEENTVYALDPAVVDHLPAAAWQLPTTSHGPWKAPCSTASYVSISRRFAPRSPGAPTEAVCRTSSSASSEIS